MDRSSYSSKIRPFMDLGHGEPADAVYFVKARWGRRGGAGRGVPGST